jgi:Zn-dependent peptidase ImmA (M78 family)
MNKNFLSRPRTWNDDSNIFINENRYDMNHIHHFVLRCLGEYKITFKRQLYKKTGMLGYCILDEGLILLDCSLSGKKREKHITILHELFHIFFHDDNDTRDDDLETKKDPVEERAELSAKNMYLWYKKNPLYFNHFMEKISVSQINKKE